MPNPRPPSRARSSAARLLVASCATAMLVGCGSRDTGGSSGSGGDVAGACLLDDQLAWVESSMRDYYLYYDQVPVVRRSDFDGTTSLLQALRVPPDSFSFITDAARSAALFDAGERTGYGWHLTRRPDDALLVLLTDVGSPLERAGVRRGDIVRTVDGLDETTLTRTQRAELLGTGDDVLTVRLGIEAPDGTRREIEVTRDRYAVRGVQQIDIVQRGALRIGYLNFTTFVEPARLELDAAFAELAAANIDELVLDLRFNGGGRVNVANELASRIGGSGVQGRDFSRLRFNDKAAGVPSGGVPLAFVELTDSLDLGRVYVLNGPGTCSASEMVINGLEPFVDVVTIGQATCGKPFGFRGIERCDEALFAVEFEFVNDAGAGGYVDGIAPDCPVAPDDSSPLGTPAEPLFAAALQHIDTATCPALVASEASTGTQRRVTAPGPGEPGWRNPVDPFGNDLPPD